MKKYEVTGVIEYCAHVSCEVEAKNEKEAKEMALEKFNEKCHSVFPEMSLIIVDQPIEI